MKLLLLLFIALFSVTGCSREAEEEYDELDREEALPINDINDSTPL